MEQPLSERVAELERKVADLERLLRRQLPASDELTLRPPANTWERRTSGVNPVVGVWPREHIPAHVPEPWMGNGSTLTP